MTVAEQVKFADQILGSLVATVYHDETTDPSGFTITKRQLEKHVGKIMETVKRGSFQPIPKDKQIKF